MNKKNVHVLLVEDNPGDTRLIREQLAEAGACEFKIETVHTLANAVERCSRPGVDAVLLDLGLPDSVGLATLKTLLDGAPELPVVVLTGLSDETIAVQAVQAGAQDYLIKGELGGMLMPRALRYAIERKRAEIELQKLQKLQSVGTLAGGIAHDFNNILMGVFGNISLAKDELAEDHPSYTALEEAEKSMSRAVRLTSQLLTFAKGGNPVKANVCLGSLIQDVAHFDLSGSPVKLVYQQPDDLWPAEADKGQIQQVISNLTINARQAMPKGGCLYITLQNAVLPATAIPGLHPGNYVKVTVRDEGTGIDPKNIDRIFDPYFTTKQTGSGLGLATTYSIITKHGGHLGVVSELGQGATFTFYLPAAEFPQAEEAQPPAAPGPALNRPVRILVMDDEEIVCRLVERMLTRSGFVVATAPSGQEAIAMYQQAIKDGAPFDAVILDLTVPGGIGGKDAIKELLTIDPQVNAIVSSGYADDPVMANYADYGFKGVAAKPYTPNELRTVLAQLLSKIRTPDPHA